MVDHIGLYPGTFDPDHNGHLDIIGRAVRLVDRLVIGVASNIGKGPLFPLEERVELRESRRSPPSRTAIGPRSRLSAFNGLLIEFARGIGAIMIVRGLRAVSDFDYEFQMAGMNYRLAPDIETVFLMASEHHQFISSKLVKEMRPLGGDVSRFVPPLTLERTLKRLDRS